MKIRVLTSSVALALCLVAALFAQAQQAQHASEGDAKIVINRNLVILDVTVLDKSGKVIPGLTKADFEVLEDGKPQTLSVFEFQKLDHDNAASNLPAPPALSAGSTPVPKVAADRKSTR